MKNDPEYTKKKEKKGTFYLIFDFSQKHTLITL